MKKLNIGLLAPHYLVFKHFRRFTTHITHSRLSTRNQTDQQVEAVSSRHLQSRVLPQRTILPCSIPLNFKQDEEIETLRSLELDVLVVIAYGLILPTRVLETPRHGCINVHASLLPRWRGASPIQQSLLHGDKETGVTIMQMDKRIRYRRYALSSVYLHRADGYSRDST